MFRRGGVVDYQSANKDLEPGHERFGRVEEGLFKEWSADRPVHLVAYSLGAPTARYLQHLLVLRAFRDQGGDVIETSGAWVSTILCVNGCNNGSVAVHAVGLSRKTLEPVRLSILWWIFTAVYILVWVNLWFVDQFFDLRLDHWKVQRKHGVGIIRLMRWRPGGTDNGGKDLCPKRAAELNTEIRKTLPQADTRYIACFSSFTRRVPDLPTALRTLSQRHLPDWRMLLRFPYCFFLVPFALIIGITSWGHQEESMHDDFEANDESKYASDGVVSVRCQQAPIGETVVASLGSCEELSASAVPPGAWTHVFFGAFDHVEVVQDGKRQRLLFEKICAFLVECERARYERSQGRVSSCLTDVGFQKTLR